MTPIPRTHLRSFCKRAIIVPLVLAAITLATWDALSPRHDWHKAPIQLLPLRFEVLVGHVRIDTVWHALAAAVAPPLLVLLLGLPRTRRLALWVTGGYLGWSLLIELLQGFLPYRNFELTDVLANLVGSLVAFGLLKLFRTT